MDVTTETLTPTRVRLTITVPFADLEPSVTKAYRNVSSQLRVPGFRPGKVPRALVDQRVGRTEVLNEALQEALPQFYGQAVQDSNVPVLARPEVDVTTFNDGEPLVFTAEVDVRPTLELASYDNLAVVVDDADVTEADIDGELEELRNRRAELVSVSREVAVGDTITVDLATTVDGETVEGGDASGLSYVVGDEGLVPGLDEAITGAAVDAPVVFTTELLQGEQAGKTAEITATARTVKEKSLPDLDDAFATTAGPYESVAELRTAVEENLGRVKKLQQGLSARDKALEMMLEATEVPVPEAVVHGEEHARRDQLTAQLQQYGLTLEAYLAGLGRPVEEWEAEQRTESEKAVRAQLLLDAIAEKEEIGVSEEDLTGQLVRRAQRSGMSPDVFAQQLVQSGNLGLLADEVRRGKALAMVLEQATVTDASGRPVDLESLRDDPSDDVSELEELADEMDVLTGE